MQLLSSARPPSPGSQDLYLDASEKYKVFHILKVGGGEGWGTEKGRGWRVDRVHGGREGELFRSTQTYWDDRELTGPFSMTKASWPFVQVLCQQAALCSTSASDAACWSKPLLGIQLQGNSLMSTAQQEQMCWLSLSPACSLCPLHQCSQNLCEQCHPQKLSSVGQVLMSQP